MLYILLFINITKANLKIYIDVDGIKYVINFDYPNSSEDYIHRIGRTGRSDTTGTSYAFFTPQNSRQARDLISVLKEANQVFNYQIIQDPLILACWLLHKLVEHECCEGVDEMGRLCLRCSHVFCLNPILNVSHIELYFKRLEF